MTAGVSLQVLCGQELPYAGLLEKVDQELLWKVCMLSSCYFRLLACKKCTWKGWTSVNIKLLKGLQAENSDVSAKPTPYKLLYSLHMYRHNWRRAAAYMYRYTVRLREESREPALPEELRGLGASINALQLVDPTNAWFHLPSRACEWFVPSKRQRLSSSDSGQCTCVWIPIDDLTGKHMMAPGRSCGLLWGVGRSKIVVALCTSDSIVSSFWMISNNRSSERWCKATTCHWPSRSGEGVCSYKGQNAACKFWHQASCCRWVTCSRSPCKSSLRISTAMNVHRALALFLQLLSLIVM